MVTRRIPAKTLLGPDYQMGVPGDYNSLKSVEKGLEAMDSQKLNPSESLLGEIGAFSPKSIGLKKSRGKIR